MKITVHRGTNQIGGCVTEYECNGWKLFVDYGEQLPGTAESDKVLEIDGLTSGDLHKSALLITHYHGDHIGKIAALPAELPIFIGKISKEIAIELSEHLSPVSDEQCCIAKRLKSVKTFSPGEQFSFGEFNILPIVIDHSAFDAYAFRIEAKDLKVFHTGDFRTHGFRSGKLPKVIETYVGKVDYVVCEATNVNRQTASSKSEHELQAEYLTAFNSSKYNVVYVSSTNIDRLFGLYHAAVKAHRPFYVDSYQKRIMDIVAGRDSIWGKSRLYKYAEGKEPIVLQRDGSEFRINDKFKAFIEEKGYVLIARAGARFDNLLSAIPSQGRRTFLSMWSGYLNETNAAYNPNLAKSIGSDYEYLHTSGHCDMASLDGLFELLKPKAIIPIHTNNPKGFAAKFCNKWTILLLEDGESFSAINEPGYDNTVARIMSYQPLDSSIKIVENKEELSCWSVVDKTIGDFVRCDNAVFALHHAMYAPNQVFACSIEDNEDMAPYHYIVYSPNFTVISEYIEGGHKPGGTKYQQQTPFAQGDRVLAIINDILVPCEIVGPVSLDYFKREYELEEFCGNITFKKFISQLWDWDWDKVVVRPLVKLQSESINIVSDIAVPRIYLFPYKDLEI